MVDAKVLEFMVRVEQDSELGAKVRAVRVEDKGGAYAELARIAADAGYSVSGEALESALRGCASGELTDEDLEAVSGGVVAYSMQSLSYTSTSLKTSAFSSFFNFAYSDGGLADSDGGLADLGGR